MDFAKDQSGKTVEVTVIRHFIQVPCGRRASGAPILVVLTEGCRCQQCLARAHRN